MNAKTSEVASSNSSWKYADDKSAWVKKIEPATSSSTCWTLSSFGLSGLNGAALSLALRKSTQNLKTLSMCGFGTSTIGKLQRDRLGSTAPSASKASTCWSIAASL